MYYIGSLQLFFKIDFSLFLFFFPNQCVWLHVTYLAGYLGYATYTHTKTEHKNMFLMPNFIVRQTG